MRTDVSDRSGKHRGITGTCDSPCEALAAANATQNKNFPAILWYTGATAVQDVNDAAARCDSSSTVASN